MATLGEFTFDALTEGATVTASAPWSVNIQSTATIRALAAAAKFGSFGMEVASPVPGTNARLSWTETNTTETRVIYAYIRIVSLAPTAQTYIQGGIDGSLAGTSDIRINVNGTVAIRNLTTVVPGTGDNYITGGSTVGTSTSALALNTWYRLEKMMRSNSTQEVRIFNEAVSATVPIITLGGALTNNNRARYDIGLPAAAPGAVVQFDLVRMADDWVGAASASAVTATGAITITGTALARRTQYVIPINPPIFANHRALVPGPASTVKGYALADALSSPSWMDIDIQRLHDGTWVLCHDADIDLLVHSTSPIQTGEVDVAFNLAQWKTIRFKNNDNTDWDYGATLNEIAAIYGPGGPKAGRYMFIEIKTTSPYAPGLDLIESLGLAPQTIFCSFSRAPIQEASRRGMMTQFVTNTPVWSELVDDGVDILGINKASLTSDIITQAHSRGILVAPFDIVQKSESDSLIAMGADIIVTSAPATLAPTPTGAGWFLVTANGLVELEVTNA